jgi:DNA-binding transcriptional LysR family regulator
VEVRHLRYFVAVAEELNFGRAAARLQIAQPGLSQQIRSMEAELGLNLFERTKRRVTLTEAGSVLLAEAYATLSRFDQTLERMRELRAGARRSTLRIAMFPNCPLGRPLVTELRRRLPQVVVALESLPSAALVQGVERGEVEFGVVRSIPPYSRVSRRLLVTEPLGVCLPTNHPLAKSATIRAAALSGLPMIWMPRSANPDLYDEVVSALVAAGLQLDAVESAGNILSTLELVSQGLGWALACESEVVGGAPGVIWKRLANIELVAQTWAVWPAKGTSDLTRQALDALLELPVLSAAR